MIGQLCHWDSLDWCHRWPASAGGLVKLCQHLVPDPPCKVLIPEPRPRSTFALPWRPPSNSRLSRHTDAVKRFQAVLRRNHRIMMTRRAAILMSLMLTACSSGGGVSLPIPVYVPPSPPTEKAIIESATKLAKDARLVAPLQISAVRKTDHGPADYFVCLTEENPPPDKPRRYYSVFFDNDAYKGSRQSVILDECEAQAFSPLPAPTPEPTTPEPAADKPAKHKPVRSATQ